MVSNPTYPAHNPPKPQQGASAHTNAAGGAKPKTYPKVRGVQPANETEYKIFLHTVEVEKQFKAGKYKYDPKDRLSQRVMSPDFKKNYRGDHFMHYDDQMHAEQAKGLDGRTWVEKQWDGVKQWGHDTWYGKDEIKTEVRTLSAARKKSLTPQQRKAFNKKNTAIAKKEFMQGEIDAGRMAEPLPANANKFQKVWAGVKMWWRGMDSVEKFNTLVSLVPILGEASQLARNLVALKNGEEVTPLDWAGCIPLYGSVSKGAKVIKTVGEVSKIAKMAEYGVKGMKVLEEADKAYKVASRAQKIVTAIQRGGPAAVAYGTATYMEVHKIAQETGMSDKQVISAIYQGLKNGLASDSNHSAEDNPIRDAKNVARATTAITGNPKLGAAAGASYAVAKSMGQNWEQPSFRTGASKEEQHQSGFGARAESYNDLAKRLGASHVVRGETGATTLEQGPDGKPVLFVPDASKLDKKWAPIHDEFVKRITDAAAKGEDVTHMLSGKGKAEMIQQIQVDLAKTANLNPTVSV